MRKEKEFQRSPVPTLAKQERSVPPEWAWTEPAIWSQKMVHTLVNGVKGNKWYSLADKVWSRKSLEAAAQKVLKLGGSAGIDRISTQCFRARIGAELNTLSEELQRGRYRPLALRRVDIPKLGSKETRTLGIPSVRDRVVQTAIVQAIQPIFELHFAAHSYGYRPNRDAKQAVRRVSQQLEAGYTWVVEADIQAYFDNLDHEQLMAKITEYLSDGRILEWIRKFLQQPIAQGPDEKRLSKRERGVAQGSPLSPLLGNIYLNALDHEMAAQGREMTRFADDLIVQCRTQAEAEVVMEQMQAWMKKHQLHLHPSKTKVVQVSKTQGFDFVGYHFRITRDPPHQTLRTIRDKSLKQWQAKVRLETQRNNGTKLAVILEEINKKVKGFIRYFEYVLSAQLSKLDAWIRVRLRAILRKRHGKTGGRNRKHQREWPNEFFAKAGLVSLVQVWTELGNQRTEMKFRRKHTLK